jgi:hypothetical protein
MYCTPIWDVLAPKGEQVGVGEHLTMRSRSPAFPIGQAVPVGPASGLVLLLGSLGLVFQGLKYIYDYT